jgi:hypothetical protein
MPRDHRNARPYWPHSQPEPIHEADIPDAPVCPGKCNAAWRAAEERVRLHGGEHDLEPEPGAPVWCPPCQTEIRGALDDWPDLAVRLAEEIGSGVRTRIGEYVSGSKTRPIHEHEAPSLLLDEMAEWLPEWGATIARERGLPERPGRRPGADPIAQITDACRFLTIHLTWHLGERPADEHERAEDFGRELLAATRRARTITGTQESEPIRVIGVACPHCDRKALEYEIEDSPTRKAAVKRYRYDGDDVANEPQTIGPDEARRLRLPRHFETALRQRMQLGPDPAGWKLLADCDTHDLRALDGHPGIDSRLTDRLDEYQAERVRDLPAAVLDDLFAGPYGIPGKAVETITVNVQGSVVGYVRCRRCRPLFRMNLDEYHKWTRMLAAGDEVRAKATAEKLREVFGNSVPVQYRVKK